MTNMRLKFLQVAEELGLLDLIPPFNFGGNKLSGVATGTADTDAVNKKQMDDVVGPAVTAQLPGVVTAQLPGEVTDQLPGEVTDQLPAEVAEQLPALVTAGLAEKVDKTEDNTILIRIDGTDTGGAIKATDFGLAKAPYACTIKKVTVISREAAADLILDILKGNTFSALASITGTGTKPTLSSAQEASVTDFTDYGSVALAAGQIVQAIATGTPGTAKIAWLMLEIERA